MQIITTQNKHKNRISPTALSEKWLSYLFEAATRPQQCLVAVAMAVAEAAWTHGSRDTSWPFPHPAGGDQHSATAASLLPWL